MQQPIWIGKGCSFDVGRNAITINPDGHNPTTLVFTNVDAVCRFRTAVLECIDATDLDDEMRALFGRDDR